MAEPVSLQGGSRPHPRGGPVVVPDATARDTNAPRLGSCRQEVLQVEIGRIGRVAGWPDGLALRTAVAPARKDVSIAHARYSLRRCNVQSVARARIPGSVVGRGTVGAVHRYGAARWVRPNRDVDLVGHLNVPIDVVGVPFEVGEFRYDLIGSRVAEPVRERPGYRARQDE